MPDWRLDEAATAAIVTNWITVIALLVAFAAAIAADCGDAGAAEARALEHTDTTAGFAVSQPGASIGIDAISVDVVANKAVRADETIGAAGDS